MNAFRTAALVAAGTLALAACGRNEGRSGANSAESHAPGTTLASAPGSCGSYAPGTPGVIRTFCNGPAMVKLNVAGKDYVLKGGSCDSQMGLLSVNLGVVSGPDLGGPKPDYFGLSAPLTPGPFSNAVLAVNIGGKGYAVTRNSGVHDAASGSFEGTALGDGTKISGSFTC